MLMELPGLTPSSKLPLIRFGPSAARLLSSTRVQKQLMATANRARLTYRVGMVKIDFIKISPALFDVRSLRRSGLCVKRFLEVILGLVAISRQLGADKPRRIFMNYEF